MVKFMFKIGKAFLDYDWHPITIPKEHHKRLEQERLAANSVSIQSPFGTTSGSIYYGRAGFGPFYQIKMDGGGSRDPMTEFEHGTLIAVEIERLERTVCVRLQKT